MSLTVRCALPLLLLLFNASCSVSHILLAVVANGAVTFVPKSAATAQCLYNLEMVDEDRTTVWRIVAASRANAERRTCAAFNFPLVYGRAPPAVETVVPPAPLQDGRGYLVRASISYEGQLGGNSAAAFRYAANPPTVQNIDHGSGEHLRLLSRVSPIAR